VFAEFETNHWKEHQPEGITKAKAAGFYKGRPTSRGFIRTKHQFAQRSGIFFIRSLHLLLRLWRKCPGDMLRRHRGDRNGGARFRLWLCEQLADEPAFRRVGPPRRMRRVDGVRSWMRLVHGFGAGKAFNRRVSVGMRHVVEMPSNDQGDYETYALHLLTTPSKSFVAISALTADADRIRMPTPVPLGRRLNGDA
jgi:hypothetical protein